MVRPRPGSVPPDWYGNGTVCTTRMMNIGADDWKRDVDPASFVTTMFIESISEQSLERPTRFVRVIGESLT